MEWAVQTENGVRIAVRVVPRSAADKVQGIHANALKVRLQAPPVEGKANDALLHFLSRKLSVPRNAISIEWGETSRDKQILVAGIDRQTLLEKLNPAGGSHDTGRSDGS